MAENRINVILVDDHPAVRAGIRQFIDRDPSMQVVAEGKDGAQALELIREYHPDVAVVDLQMPRLTGLDVINEARQAGLRRGIHRAYGVR